MGVVPTEKRSRRVLVIWAAVWIVTAVFVGVVCLTSASVAPSIRTQMLWLFVLDVFVVLPLGAVGGTLLVRRLTPTVSRLLSSSGASPGWYPDPSRRHEFRYWTGHEWTTDVADGGEAGTDSVIASD